MKKILKGLAFLSLAFFMCFGLIACQQTKSENQNSNGSKVSETIELGTATLGDVEFENADTVELKNENGQYNVTGTITAMSESQIIAFGVQDVTGTFNFNAVLLVNNQPLNDTFNQSPVIRNSTSNRMTLTSTVILRLQAGDILKLEGVSIEDIRYDNARIDIEKIG